MNIIHYWDTQIKNVRARYLGLEFRGHTTNSDLLNRIEDGISMLNMKHLKQILIDCPNVNWKLFECFINKQENPKNILI